MLRSVSSRHTARLVKKSFPVAELAGGRKFREVSMILKSRSSHTVFQAVGQHVARPTRVATAVAAILLNVPALAGKGLDREVQFDIPRQPLEEALLAFSKQADVQILVDGSSLSGRESEGLSGRFAVRDALYRLLRSDEFLVDTLGETVRVRSALAQASEHQQSSATAADENTRGQMVDSSSKTRVDPPTTSTLTEYRVTTPEVLIIGSRSMNMDIRRTEDDIQPYVVFEREQIQRSGAADLEDFFKNHLPMNAANTTIAQVANDPSLSFGNISLRGLGPEQTLILVDGQRLPSATAGSNFFQPDISGIPLAAIERIDVLPATASGIYGGSATGGVINIIRKQDYSGLELQATYGDSFKGDVGHSMFTAAGGWTFGGRTNVAFTASYAEDDPLRVSDRDFAARARALLIANNPDVLADPGLLLYSTTANLCAATQVSPTNAFCNGNELVLDDGRALGASITSVPEGHAGAGSDGGAALLENAGGYNLSVPTDGAFLRRGATRSSASFNLQHKFNQTVAAFLDVMHNESVTPLSRAGAGVPVFLAADDPGNPFQQNIFVALPHPDLHLPGETEYVTTRATAGVSVWLPRQWAANLTGGWSRGRLSYENTSASAANALLTPEGLALLRGSALQDLRTHPVDIGEHLRPVPDIFGGPFDTILKTAALRLSGPVWRLPGGDVGVTFMAEHRREKAREAFKEDPSDSSPLRYYPERSNIVDSYYLEARMPILGPAQSLSFADSLDLLAAVRHDRYDIRSPRGQLPLESREGPFPEPEYFTNELSSTDYMFGVRYAPTPDISFRASVSTGFLPPALSYLIPDELEIPFLPFPIPGLNPPDPRRGNTPLSTPRVDILGGNPNVRPEQSESWSAGLILRPRALDGLRVSIDYTRIEKEDEIFVPITIEFIIANEASFPGRVVRGPNLPTDPEGWAGPVLLVDASALNLSSTRVDSIDLQIDYEWTTARAGNFYWMTVLTRTEKFERKLTADTETFDAVGYSDGPLAWRGQVGLRWERGPWGAGWQAQYYDSYSVELANPSVAFQNPDRVRNQGRAHVPSQIYHDFFVRYRFEGNTSSWWNNTVISLGIQNVFDKEPPIIAPLSLTTFGSADYSGYGDPRLRRFELTIRKSFGG